MKASKHSHNEIRLVTNPFSEAFEIQDCSLLRFRVMKRYPEYKESDDDLGVAI